MTSAESTHVIEPLDQQALAIALQDAAANGLAVVPSGSGTKLHWWPPLPHTRVVLSTRRLDSSIEHWPGDLTATLPAGATLSAVNEVLAVAHQWLPLDPQSSPTASIGGIVATNDSGPRRHGYGTPRDLIIGVEMTLANGRTARAGGRVVKNVAGYDLSRLLCGSMGGLAVITRATFKLAPLPRASRTVEITGRDARGTVQRALAIGDLPLTPSALEIDGPPYRLIVRFESTEATAERETEAVLSLCSREERATVLSGESESSLWNEFTSRMRGPDTLARMSILPTQVAELVARVDRLAPQHSVTYKLWGRAAIGVLYLRLHGHPDVHASLLATLRAAVEANEGSLVVLTAPEIAWGLIDPWGAVGNSLPLMRSVKAHFDPGALLNPGRGPGGI